jgi:intracellular multiplication protein IcmJ
MYPVELKIQPAAWQVFSSRKASAGFSKFSEKILARDRYTCQFCGFQARDYQEVVNLDQDYYNNNPKNLVTACCFCAQCFFLDAVGVSYGGGTLIVLPEISQTWLNSFCHVLFTAISNDTVYKQTAQNVYRTLKFRSKPLENLIQEGVSDPSSFSQMVIDTMGLNAGSPTELLTHIRLLPSRARFKTQIDRWAQTAMDEIGA